MVPLLLVILGLVYSVHVISAYYDELRAAPGARSARAAWCARCGRIALPDAARARSPRRSACSRRSSRRCGAMREFGWLVAGGDPGGLRRRGHGDSRAPARVRPAAPASRAAARRRRPIASRASPPRPRARRAPPPHADLGLHRVLVLSLLLAAASRVQISTDTAARVSRATTPVRLDFDAINRRLDGATSFSVVIDGGYRERVRRRRRICASSIKLQRWLEQQPEVGGTTLDRRLARPAPPRGGAAQSRRSSELPADRERLIAAAAAARARRRAG